MSEQNAAGQESEGRASTGLPEAGRIERADAALNDASPAPATAAPDALADKLESYIPDGDGYNSEYARTLQQAADALRQQRWDGQEVTHSMVCKGATGLARGHFIINAHTSYSGYYHAAKAVLEAALKERTK